MTGPTDAHMAGQPSATVSASGAARPRRILVPTDFSECSERALEMALRIAESFDAEVHALHVCVLLAHALQQGAHPDAPGFEARVKADIERRLAALRASVETQGAKLTTHCLDGNPAERILDEARRLGADLIAMGTHGRRGIDRVLLGSVAERVMRTAQVPLLTVH